ncbi:MAG: hypothetical protein M3Q83_01375 [Pseudomonadota bacterium]|nr:hypothetical protein [Pseudomonadota bacterium]
MVAEALGRDFFDDVGEEVIVGIAVAEPFARRELERPVFEHRNQGRGCLRPLLGVGIFVEIVDVGDTRGVAEQVMDRQPVAIGVVG